ncbi:MAG: hypothetical protein WCA49_05090 [Candidatus Sulfotelmatobacter sp.]
MAIRRKVSVPDIKLPPAILYLDDLEEIIEALKPDIEALRRDLVQCRGHDLLEHRYRSLRLRPDTPELDSPDKGGDLHKIEDQTFSPRLEFTVGDRECDSLEDLHKIGGQTKDFEMEVVWNSYTRLHITRGNAWIYVGEDLKRKVWTQEQIRQIFARRARWTYRNRWWLLLGTILVWLAAVHATFRDFALDIPIGLAPLVPAVLYFFEGTSKSVVILKHFSEREGSWFKRNKEKIEVAAITSVVSGIIGALIAFAVRRLSAK